MISNKVIQSLYKTYNKRPESPDFLDMSVLFDYASKFHNVTIDMDGVVDTLIINSIEETSPFHNLPLKLIHAIVPFEKWVAIVLRSSIIFLDRDSSRVNIHIRNEKPSLSNRLRNIFGK